MLGKEKKLILSAKLTWISALICVKGFVPQLTPFKFWCFQYIQILSLPTNYRIIVLKKKKKKKTNYRIIKMVKLMSVFRVIINKPF